MSQTHWKKLHNPDYLGAYALEPGKDLIVTIASVGNELVTGSDGKKEECTVLHFSGPVKPMVLNATNAKVIEKLMGSPYVEEWAGRQIQLYATKVKEPDIGLFDLPQSELDAAMEVVREKIGRFDRIKKGLEKPDSCGRCAYCRSVKRLTGWVDFREMALC